MNNAAPFGDGCKFCIGRGYELVAYIANNEKVVDRVPCEHCAEVEQEELLVDDITDEETSRLGYLLTNAEGSLVFANSWLNAPAYSEFPKRKHAISMSLHHISNAIDDLFRADLLIENAEKKE